MKKLRVGWVLLLPFLMGAAPTRQVIYTAGEVINSADVTSNEDAVLNYLQAGVDTVKDNTIVNADINTSANIQASKINLTSINQNIANTGTFTNTGDIDFTGDIMVSGTVACPDLSGSWTNKQASLCVGVDGTIFAQDGGCN